MMGMCVLHLTCESTCRGRYRGPWISPGLLDLVEPWSDVLGRNIAIAAGLCAAFRLGAVDPLLQDCPCSACVATVWRPGCNRPAPGFGDPT